jgi:NAD(P)H-dependent FMN reductase
MLTIFHGTARPNSQSRKIANIYDRILGEKNVPHTFFTLENIEPKIFSDVYNTIPKNPQLINIENQILGPTEKYIFIIPEYNGSFPGMLKGFIDACDVKKCYHNKKGCLVGVSDGRAGNLRGMEHMTNILNHLRMNILHLKLPLSLIDDQLDANEQLTNPEYLKMINTQIDLFLNF